MADPRKIVLDVLLRVEGGAYADLALDAALRSGGLDPRDRALATELVYGILRHRGRLDFAVDRFSRSPLARLETKVLWLLRLGAYQILQLDRVPDRAAVHTTVELARQAGLARAAGFLNAVLRSLGRERDAIPWPDREQDPRGHLEHALSLPPWLARRWLADFGAPEACELAEAMLLPAPYTFRTNTLRLSRETLLERFRQSGQPALPTRYAPEGIIFQGRREGIIPGTAEGWFQVQDEASMLIPRLLDPRPQEKILDACAAPGGKTTQIAALTGNQARITAFDLHPQRITLVLNGARRLGAEGIEGRPWDLTRPPDFLAPAGFDRVLVDAPCSGLGVLRRNPEIRWRRQEAELAGLADLQAKILRQAAPLVRPGGCLLYSVCTFTPEETTGVLSAFLAAHPEFAREDLRETSPREWRELFGDSGALRTFPHRHGGMDAFFAVRLRKR